MQKFLVATDFSPHADRALAHALRAREALRRRARAVHVGVHPAAPARGDGDSACPRRGSTKRATRRPSSSRRSPATLRARRRPCRPRLVSRPRSRRRDLRARGDEIGADLVAAGTRGHTGLAHVVFGSVAERVARLAHGAGADRARRLAEARAATGCVLVPTDFSPDADVALAWARALVAEAPAARSSLHARVRPGLAGHRERRPSSTSVEPRRVEKSAREKLAAIAKSLAGVDGRDRPLARRVPTSPILETAESAKRRPDRDGHARPHRPRARGARQHRRARDPPRAPARRDR